MIVCACGIDSLIYLYTPEVIPDSIGTPGEGIAGCIYDGDFYTNDAKISIFIRGFDIFYSYFPDLVAAADDPYLSILKQSNINIAAANRAYPLKINGQEYWRLFKGIPGGGSIDPFHLLINISPDSEQRETYNFNIIVNTAESPNIFYETNNVGGGDVTDIYTFPGASSNIYRWVKEDDSATERDIKDFDHLQDDDEDVKSFREKYPSAGSEIRIYFYFFIWAIDSNRARVYCDEPLRVGPINKSTL